MKTKIFMILFFYFSLFTFYSVHSQNKTFKLGFTGAYPHNYNYTQTSRVNWSWYEDLSMNMWSGWWIGENWQPNATADVLDNLAEKNIDGLFQPDTIRWAGLGRQVILQAEEISDRFSYTDHYNCGQNVPDNSGFGTGQLVRHYSIYSTCGTAGEPVTVLSGAKENTVQSFCGFPYDPMYQVHFPYNNYYHPEVHRDTAYINKYYIKPRMRINANDAYLNPPLNVVKVIVKAYNSNVVGEFIIRTNDFRNTSPTTYDGAYIEDYINQELWVFGDIINQGRPGPWPWGQLENCHVDYEIQWYNQVSVWIDYVKVQDEAAYRLLHPNPFLNLDSVLNQKIQHIKTNDDEGSMKGFYMEEVDYYNLACLKYLNERLPVLANDPDYKVIGLVAPWSYRTILKHKNPIQDYRDYFTAVDPPFFMSPQYPFGSPHHEYFEPVRIAKLPDNLTYNLTGYPQFVINGFNQYFANPPNTYNIVVSNTAYNSHTQNVWDAYVDSVKMMRDLCREFNKDFYLVPQIHYLMEIANNEYYLVHKEPLNSEISAEFCIALCHGAVGIIPYAYESGYWYSHPTLPTHTYGITNFTEQLNWGHSKRTFNFYGENKWQYIEDLYGKIKVWGSVIANSTNTSGFSVASEGANHNYISDIASIDPHKTGQNPCSEDSIGDGGGGFLWLDCEDERYWEMGFFGSTERNTKYFIMVNRRCMPAGGGYDGDDRVLRIKFNPSNLPEAVNWEIYDAANPDIEPVTFSKNYQGYINIGSAAGTMGWFQPGEGKLYKMVPVMKSGGNLVADEYIPSGESFTCEDTVWTNGYNLTIENGVTIHFSDSAKFVVEGGTFQIGDDEYSGPNNITMDAPLGGSWKGFEFNGATVKIYGVNFSGLANDSISMLSMLDCPLIDLRNNSFSLGTGNNKSVIDIAYSGSYQPGVTDNVYIGSNTFSNSSTVLPYVKIMAYSGITIPVIIESNTFTGSSTALFLSNIQGGAIKSNTFTGFDRSITALSSSLDIYDNTISSTGTYGINALSGTELKMSYAGGLLVGGKNNITNSDSSSSNIYLDDPAPIL